jgi:hypothetical protein
VAGEVQVKPIVRTRFWVETALALVAAMLAALTAITPDWIEAISGIDPDAHSGSVERMVVFGLIAICVALSIAARSELRRSRAGAAATT